MRTTGGRNAQAACCVRVERGLHSQEHRVATLWSNTGAALPLSLRCLHVAWPLSQTMMLQKSARRQVLCTRAHHHSLRQRSPASFGKMVVLHAEINLSKYADSGAFQTWNRAAMEGIPVFSSTAASDTGMSCSGTSPQSGSCSSTQLLSLSSFNE